MKSKTTIGRASKAAINASLALCLQMDAVIELDTTLQSIKSKLSDSLKRINYKPGDEIISGCGRTYKISGSYDADGKSLVVRLGRKGRSVDVSTRR